MYDKKDNDLVECHSLSWRIIWNRTADTLSWAVEQVGKCKYVKVCSLPIGAQAAGTRGPQALHIVVGLHLETQIEEGCL